MVGIFLLKRLKQLLIEVVLKDIFYKPDKSLFNGRLSIFVTIRVPLIRLNIKHQQEYTLLPPFIKLVISSL